MKVQPSTPLPQALNEILRPYGLQTQDGPGGSILIVKAEADKSKEETGIAGLVRNQLNQKPLAGVNITISGEKTVTIAGGNGRFLIRNMNPGTYALEAGLKGFAVKRVQNISVVAGQMIPLLIDRS